MPLSVTSCAALPSVDGLRYTARVRRLPWSTQGKLAMRAVRQRLGDPAPLIASLYVTDRCNVRCDGCLFYDSLYTEQKPRREDTATILRILDALELEGLPIVSYLGGEPFLRRDLPEILHAGKARGFAQSVVTNGMIDAPRTLEACEATCEAVIFSPHPPDELAGKGAERRWGEAWAGFRRLRGGLKHAELTVGITLSRHTAPRLEEILTRALDGGADRVRCHPHFYPRQFPTAEQVLAMREVLEQWTAREPERMDDPSLFLTELQSYFGDVPRIPCTAGRKFNVGIYLDGSVSACCPERVIIGNILETPLRQMRARPDQMRTDCFGCHRTEVLIAKRYCG
jgi:MoaA/NifB/PqqE/SkfB family radical SAM enzyme